jgi:hypothetical protein
LSPFIVSFVIDMETLGRGIPNTQKPFSTPCRGACVQKGAQRPGKWDAQTTARKWDIRRPESSRAPRMRGIPVSATPAEALLACVSLAQLLDHLPADLLELELVPVKAE